jgi:hypothetical protein
MKRSRRLMDGRTERESVGFTEKWFHGIIVSERKGYCEAIFLRGRETEWEVI